MSDYWVMTAVGTVERVDRENVDKRGRNPKYIYTFYVRPERTEGAPAEASLPELLPVRAKDLDLQRMTGSPAPLAVGDRVELRARAAELEPTTFYLTAVGKL